MRLTTLSTSISRPGAISEPHHGQLVSCAGEVIPAVYLSARMASTNAWLSSVLPGATLLPTQSPMVKGTSPRDLSPLVSAVRRMCSIAQISAVARWNCCKVSRRRV